MTGDEELATRSRDLAQALAEQLREKIPGVKVFTGWRDDEDEWARGEPGQ